MITFNGNVLLCLHEAVLTAAPKLHAQRTQFAGIWGESQILLGAGGRPLSVKIWLSDPSFGNAAGVHNYCQALDLSLGTTANLVVSGAVQATYGDCCFEGFVPSGPVLPAIGNGAGGLMPDGSYWQPGTLNFYQLTIP